MSNSRSSFLDLQWPVVCLVDVEGILQGVGVQADRFEAWMQSHAPWPIRKLSTSIQNLFDYVIWCFSARDVILYCSGSRHLIQMISSSSSLCRSLITTRSFESGVLEQENI